MVKQGSESRVEAQSPQNALPMWISARPDTTFQLPSGEAEQLTTCVSTALGDSEEHGYPLHFKKHCRGVGRQNHRDTKFFIVFLALQMSLRGTQGRLLMELRMG